MDTFVRDLHRAVARARRWPRLERLGGGHAGGTANLKLTFHLDHSAVVGFESSRRERPGEVSGLAIARYCPAPGRIQRRSLGSVSGHENEPREGAAFRTKILDLRKGRMEGGVWGYFVGRAGSRRGLADAVPFVSRPEDYLDNSPKAEVTGK